MDVAFLLLPGILAVGFHASYTDSAHGKIRNKTILVGVAYALLAWSLLGMLVGFKAVGGLLLFMNAFSAILLGYALWHFGAWSPGDGKLFTVFSIMIPAIDVWIPFTLLVNALVPALIAVAVVTVAKEKKLSTGLWNVLRPWVLVQRVKGSIPLAPFLFAGTLLTLALKTDIVLWLYSIL